MGLERSDGYSDNLSQLYWIHIGWLCGSQLLLLPAVLNQSWFLSSTDAPYNADSVLLKQNSLIIAHSFGSVSLITCLTIFLLPLSYVWLLYIKYQWFLLLYFVIKCEIHNAHWFFKFLIIILLYFSTTIYPSYTLFYSLPPSGNHHTTLCVHESFFFFAWSLHSLSPPPQSCEPAFHLWVCLYLVC